MKQLTPTICTILVMVNLISEIIQAVSVFFILRLICVTHHQETSISLKSRKNMFGKRANLAFSKFRWQNQIVLLLICIQTKINIMSNSLFFTFFYLKSEFRWKKINHKNIIRWTGSSLYSRDMTGFGAWNTGCHLMIGHHLFQKNRSLLRSNFQQIFFFNLVENFKSKLIVLGNLNTVKSSLKFGSAESLLYSFRGIK